MFRSTEYQRDTDGGPRPTFESKTTHQKDGKACADAQNKTWARLGMRHDSNIALLEKIARTTRQAHCLTAAAASSAAAAAAATAEAAVAAAVLVVREPPDT